jgi:hypothetical protein
MIRFSRLALLVTTVVCIGQFHAFSKPGNSLSGKDLRQEWKIFRNEVYVPYDGEATSVIYFEVNTDQYYRDKLIIEDNRPFTVFVDQQLIAHTTKVSWSLDSLSKAWGKSVLSFAIHQGSLSPELTTIIRPRTDQALSDQEPLERPSFSFRDFAIAGALALLVLLIVITQLNPKLASDYFSVTKIFSLRDSDEGQVYSRITSSTNILFYVFCSLILAYYLVIIFHFVPHRFSLAAVFYSDEFLGALYHWIELSAIILGVFLLKIVLIYALTFLFGTSDLVGFHFFNWVRVLLVTFGILTAILSIYFIVHGQRVSFFSFLFFVVPWISGGFIVLMFMKLSVRARQSLFHIFSYICATELIPFLITLKVLFN